MPIYTYACPDCSNEDNEFLFDTKYGFSATPEEIAEATKCPQCDKVCTQQVLSPPAVVGVRGGNWAEYRQKNKGAMKRDMDLYNLQKGNDPYATSRVPGETDYLIDSLRAAKTPKPKRQYFT